MGLIWDARVVRDQLTRCRLHAVLRKSQVRDSRVCGQRRNVRHDPGNPGMPVSSFGWSHGSLSRGG